MKKLLAVILAVAFVFLLTGCANSIFMASYQTPLSEKTYSDFTSTYNLSAAPQFTSLTGKYEFKGEFRLKHLTEDLYYSADLTVDFTQKSIKGETRTVRHSIFETSDITTTYSTKKGIITKKSPLGTETLSGSEVKLTDLLLLPDEAFIYYLRIYERLQNMPFSYVEIAEKSDCAKFHVGITPQTAHYLLFNGITPQNATGDFYISVDRTKGVNGVRLLLSASRGDNYYGSGDIFSGISQLYDDVIADFTIRPL